MSASKTVRDALQEIAASTTNHRVMTAAAMLVAHMTDDEAERLGRLLK